jgi:hypothetical protein
MDVPCSLSRAFVLWKCLLGGCSQELGRSRKGEEMKWVARSLSSRPGLLGGSARLRLLTRSRGTAQRPGALTSRTRTDDR